MMKKGKQKEFPDLVEAGESLACIIVTFDCGTVANEGVKKHGSIHQDIIGNAPLPDIFQRPALGRRGDPIFYFYPLAVKAIRAAAVYGYLPVSTIYSHPLFLLITVEWQGLHIP